MGQPDFLGIGAPKAGTTWLYENLRKHPEVWLPPTKELHYFNRSRRPYVLDAVHRSAQRRFLLRRWIKPALRSPRSAKWSLRFFLLPRSDDWYRSLFIPRADQISGDITPAYSLLSREQIGHVRSEFPDVKLILITRDPVDRIWSHAAMHFDRYGHRGLSNATRSEIENFVRAPHVLARSNYAAILARWSAFFPASQIHLCAYEDLAKDPAGFFGRVCKFLEIAQLSVDGIEQSVNVRAYSPPPSWARSLIETQLHELTRGHRSG